MSMSTLFRKLVASSTDFGSTDSGCEMDINVGIYTFIQSGTASIIQAQFIGAQLQDTAITLRKRNKSTSSSSSSSSSDSEKSTHVDGIDTTEQGAVRVTAINLGSFAHGIGLREDDVILTVNDKRVESANVANFLMERIIDANVKLALEIQRRETGLIRLDNGGDAIELEEVIDEDYVYMTSPKPTIYRFKHVKYSKYLTVANDKLSLSKFSTKPNLTYFEVYDYQSLSGSVGIINSYIRIQHKENKKCIIVENGNLVLKTPPTGKKLAIDSGYLFKINYPSSSSHRHAVNFEDVTTQDMAIGFQSKRKTATLLQKTEEKVLFDAFKVSS